MARLNSLPPELIEMICDYMRPIRPMRDRFADKDTSPGISIATAHGNGVERVLDLEWQYIRDLSATNRYFRRVIVYSGILHRVITLRGSFRELLRLLKLFKDFPAFALAARQLYVNVRLRGSGPRCLDVVSGLHFVLAIKDLGLDYEAAWPNIIADCNMRAVWRYSTLIRLVMAQMKGLEDIGVAFEDSHLFDPVYVNHGFRDFASQEFVPDLPHLRSVTMRMLTMHDLAQRDFQFFLRMGPVEQLYIDTPNSNPDLQPLRISFHGNLLLGSVTSLILTSTSFYPNELEALLRYCAPLTTFKWIVNDMRAATRTLPWQVVACLRSSHGTTLQTLCLKFLPVTDYSQLGTPYITGAPIGSLWGFDALESLWIDLNALNAAPEIRSGGSLLANFHTLPWNIGPPQHFVASLPPTLKKGFFYVPDRTSKWDDSVVWLARAKDMFPGLSDILYYNAFRNCTFRMVRRRPYRCPFVPALRWD